LDLTNATSYSFKAAMGASPDAEKYIILRKAASTLSDLPFDGVTYKVGDRIGESVVAYVGDSTVSNLRPKYILAGTDYHFEAFSFNGPAGFENYLTSSSFGSNITTLGKQPGTYYNGIDPNSPTFITTLHNKINPHDTIFYGYFSCNGGSVS
jgi:hypothetical protein